MGVSLKVLNSICNKKVAFLFFLLLASFSIQAKEPAINVVRFNNTVTYAAGSGVSVIINPTGIFPVSNVFKLELVDEFGNSSMLDEKNEFFIPVMNGPIPLGTPAGTYKLRVSAYDKNTSITSTSVLTNSFAVQEGPFGGQPAFVVPPVLGTNFTSCMDQNNFFGYLNKSLGEKTTKLTCSLSEKDASYVINLIDQFSSTATPKSTKIIPLAYYEGFFSIPANLPTGYYPIEVAKTKDGITSVFTVYYLFHTGNTALGNSSNENICLKVDVTFSISSIEENYPGSLYRINFGDGSSDTLLTQAELIINPSIIHNYSSTTCASTKATYNKDDDKYYFNVFLLLQNKGMSKGECNKYIKNGNGAIKLINASKPPAPSFTVSPTNCVSTALKVENTTEKGAYGSGSSCLGVFLSEWSYQPPNLDFFITAKPEWVDVLTQSLVIPVDELSKHGTGCWVMQLTVSNLEGCQTPASALDTVVVETMPVAEFEFVEKGLTVPQVPQIPQICPGGIVTLHNLSNAKISDCSKPNFAWTITPATGFTSVNSTSLSSENPHLIFTEPGVYTVLQTITNSCGTDTISSRLIVFGVPTVRFDTKPADICKLPKTETIIDFSKEYIPVYSNETYNIPFAYNWEVSGTVGIDYNFMNGTTNADSKPQIQFLTFKKHTVELIVSGNCKNSTSNTFSFTIRQQPEITNNVPSSACSGTSTGDFTPVWNMPGTSYTWVRVNSSGITAEPETLASGTGTIPATIFKNANSENGTATYTITPENDGCQGPKVEYIVTVTSNVIVKPIANLVLCNGIPYTPKAFESNIPGASFSWTNTDISSWLTTGGNGNLPPFTPVNAGIVPITTTIHVIPNALACEGTPLDFTITVNPTPTVAKVENQINCNGETSLPIVFAGLPGKTVDGTIYNWTNSEPGIGLAASGTGNIAAFTLTNTGTAPLVATIWVTPSYSNGGSTCDGNPEIFSLRVNPSAQVNPLPTIVVCNGAPVDVKQFTTINTGGTTTYTWTNSDTSIGLGASGTGDITSFTAKNETISPVTATINVTPAFSNGGKECSGPSQTFTITVNPTAQVDKQPVPLIVCNGQDAVMRFTTEVKGATTVFDWTIDKPDIGIAASGSSDISFTAVNTTNDPITATVTVTPKVLSGEEPCKGSSENFIITVNPTPKTILPADQTICSGGNTVDVTLTSATAGATFSWTVLDSPGVVVSEKSGTTGSIPSQKLTNTTSSPVNVVYQVTATATACVGVESIYTITVNPKPLVSAPVNSAICSGSTFNATPLDGYNGNIIPEGTTYSWEAPTISPAGAFLTGAFPLSNQTEVRQILTNTDNKIITVTYSVTPKTVNCQGEPFIVEVKVNPVPTVNDILAQTHCVGESNEIIEFTGSNVDGTVYKWTCDKKEIGIAGLEGTKEIVAFTTENTTNLPLVATITVTPTINDCAGLPKDFTITVYPKPVVTKINDIPTCDKRKVEEIKFESSVLGSTFEWENNMPTAWLAASGSGPIPAFTTENSSDAPIVATITVRSSANGCKGDPMTFKITVNPTSTVNQPDKVEVCNGSPVGTIKFDGAIENSTYNWSNDNTSIGLVAFGNNEIVSFTAVNITPEPVIATVTVTPVSGNGCAGASKTFAITVNPSPNVTFSEENQPICSGTSTVPVNLSSSTPGVTFSWTTSTPDGISGMVLSGTNQIPVQTLVNSTNAPIVITYTAFALYDGKVDCTGENYEYTITVNPVPSVTTEQVAIICSGEAFGVSPVNGSGNIVPANTLYTWSDPVIDVSGAITDVSAQALPQPFISQVLTNNTDQVATATYTVTPVWGVCSGEPFPVKVTVNPVPKVTFTEPDQILCSGTTSLPVAILSTTPDVTFKWTATIPDGITGAATDGSIALISAQTLINTTTSALTIVYYANATLDKGASCPGETSEYRITVNPPIVSSEIISDYHGFNISVAGGTDGSIDFTVSGGSGVYTYLWTCPDGTTLVSQNIANLVKGKYTLSLSDGSCGAIEKTFTLTEPLDLLIEEETTSHVDVLCNGSSTGAIGIQITQESVSPFDYALTLQSGGAVANEMNSPDTKHLFADLAAGIYKLTVTDANGNTKTVSNIEITEPTKITTTIGQKTDVLCSGENTGSATVKAEGGAGGYTYSWNTSPVQINAQATGLAAGTYIVTVTDANGCQATQSCTIKEPALIVLTIDSKTNIGCFGDNTGSATGSATGGTGALSYLWNTNPVQNMATATGLIAGTYQLTVTDENNCSKVQTVTLTQPAAALSSSIALPKNVSCFGGSDGLATVTASGGTEPYTYQWNSVPVQRTATATDLPEGTYEVIVTDNNGCTSTSSVTISQPDEILIEITDQLNVFCHDDNTGSATVNASMGTGAFTYSWNTNPVQTGAKAVGLAAGTYMVTVQDANACIMTKEVTITEPDAILTSITSQTNVDCFGLSTGSATVTASGGAGNFVYSWNTVPAQTGSTATGLAAGAYELTVTDEKGCSKTQIVTIIQPDDITLAIDSEKDITCFGNANGAIAISVKGGTEPYAYSWTKDKVNFATTEDIENLEPGEYEVTVTDVNNCDPKTLPVFTITQPELLEIKLIDQTNILCFGDATGAANVKAVGGTVKETSPGVMNYTYAWAGPDGFVSTDQNLQEIKAGTYVLTVTDNSGCSETLPVIITEPQKLTVIPVVTSVTCYGENNGSIKLEIKGGKEPYDTYWNTSNGNGELQDNLSPGNYPVMVTDANGCQVSLNLNIAQAEFYINPTHTDVTCFGAKNGSVSLNINGGEAPVKVLWSDDPKAGNVRNNLGPGSYSVTLSDKSDCRFSATIEILEPKQIVLNPAITDAFDCDNPNSGAISLTVAGGTQPYIYVWSNGATTDELTNIPAGDYLITVTDARGCSLTEKYTVKRQLPLAVDMSAAIDFNCGTKAVKGICTANVTGGIPPYELVWSGGTASGTYNQVMETYVGGLVVLNVTDALGCKTSNSFTLEIPTYGIFYDLTDCNQRGYQFDGATSKDQLYVTYLWDFGDGTNSTLKNPQHNFPAAGGFKVRLTITSTTCTSVYEKMVIVEPLPVVTIDRKALFCKGESVTVHAKGAYTYLWSDGSTADSIVINLAGEYSVRGTSKTGCTDTITFMATNYDLLNYSIQTDKNEISADQPVVHFWTETYTLSQYLWDFGDGEQAEGNDLNHTYKVMKDGYMDVNLKTINPNGCVELATKRIWMVNSSLPNTFTPNGDGINDLFMKDWHVKVFNRNGAVLYDGTEGWNGINNGRPVANDTYFYVVYYSTETGTKTQPGYLTVIR